MWHRIVHLAVLSIILAVASSAAAIEQGPLVTGNSGLIIGKILIDGREPMQGGLAGFFNAASDFPLKAGNLRRVPDHTTTVDTQGGFNGILPAGRYYLGVIARDDTGMNGPPGPEEKSFAAVTESGERRIFIIAGGGTARDFGQITVSKVGESRRPADMFTIRGRVINKDGQPFAGAAILIRRQPNAGRPVFIAEQNGVDGRFELQLPAGGPYYLIAKEELGSGRPQSGRHVGAFTGGEPVFDQNKPEPKPAPLSGRAGEILNGITIMMLEVPDSGPPQVGRPDEVLQQGPADRQPRR